MDPKTYPYIYSEYTRMLLTVSPTVRNTLLIASLHTPETGAHFRQVVKLLDLVKEQGLHKVF